ncbi:Tim10/DDP family zinc finger-domain-containing protein [Aspergillus crustosus]
MSFLFGGAPKMSSEQKIAAAETEVEMISDMFNRLTESCTKKCIPPDYREGELNKGESVCLDRCVGKFFEVNIKVSEKMQGEAAGKQGLGM